MQKQTCGPDGWQIDFTSSLCMIALFSWYPLISHLRRQLPPPRRGKPFLFTLPLFVTAQGDGLYFCASLFLSVFSALPIGIRHKKSTPGDTPPGEKKRAKRPLKQKKDPKHTPPPRGFWPGRGFCRMGAVFRMQRKRLRLCGVFFCQGSAQPRLSLFSCFL